MLRIVKERSIAKRALVLNREPPIRLAQSLAREVGPQGIHVAHVVVDGVIDTEVTRTRFPERYALKDRAGILAPDHIAENYWMLQQQPRDAWTHELDLRPWMEPF